jgi:hypothetical protein
VIDPARDLDALVRCELVGGACDGITHYARVDPDTGMPAERIRVPALDGGVYEYTRSNSDAGRTVWTYV